MMLAKQSLGIIPDWQFSTDPTINPNVNPHVTYPPGWDQLTRQPVGPAYAAPVDGMGLGATRRMRDPINPCCGNCSCGGGDPCCGGRSALRGLIDDVGTNISTATSFVADAACQQSFLCRNKWWLLLGGAGLIGAAIYFR